MTTRVSAVMQDAGAIVQVVNVMDGAVATGTTLQPKDDTIPQITEGNEFMTLAITPTSTTNKLLIQVVANLSHSTDTAWIIGALFQDSTAGALAVQGDFTAATAGVPRIITLNHYMTTGTISATTFKFRSGNDGAGTMTFNGQSGGRIFGGAYASSITITEISV